MRRDALCLVLVGILGNTGPVLAGENFSLELNCGTLASLANPYGPYDYTNLEDFTVRLPVVEQYHFTSNVENLISGITGPIAGDLDYTLRAFPNHHRALNAMARLEHRDGIQATGTSAACYFERALKFRPDDAVVYQIYGIYLYKKGNVDGAIAKLERAVELDPQSAEVHYNLGLILLSAGQGKSAALHAQRAEQLGYPLTGLKRKLERGGYWPSDAAEMPN